VNGELKVLRDLQANFLDRPAAARLAP